ncbi:hypothetical protein ACF0H5_022566 [Mactra antiquata]
MHTISNKDYSLAQKRWKHVSLSLDRLESKREKAYITVHDTVSTSAVGINTLDEVDHEEAMESNDTEPPSAEC